MTSRKLPPRGDLLGPLLDSLRRPSPCPAWLPFEGGQLDAIAGVPVRHYCAFREGYAPPHRCEDCDEEWP